MPAPQAVRETATITEAQAGEATRSGRMLVQFINPGWGSSGYYSPEVLEQAVTDNVIPAGTHMYADHPTDTDAFERPERSIKDLMAVTTTDATIGEGGALVGEIRVLAPYRELVEDMVDAIGVSIRGDATDITEGEAEGRRGRIIEGLAHVSSVDFVTRAGRGGRVLSVLESARVNRRALRHDGIEEATVNDTREALQNALRDAYGSGEHTYVWVRDFDESTVWFELEGEGTDPGTYGQAYAATDGAVALSGERTEVRVSTTYVPTTRSDSNTTTTESEEDTMPQIEESELTRLREDAGRVTALEERATTAERERDEAITERDTARGDLAETRRTARANTIVNERATDARVTFTPLELRGLMADLPLTESGDLDEAAFTTTVNEAAAQVAEAAGAGRVSGFGHTPAFGNGDITEADVDTIIAGAFGRPVKEA